MSFASNYVKYTQERNRIVDDPSFERLSNKEQIHLLLAFTNDRLSQAPVAPNEVDRITLQAFAYYQISQFERAVALCFRALMFQDVSNPETRNGVLRQFSIAILQWNSVIAAPYLLKMLLKKHANSPMREALAQIYRQLCERAYERRKKAEEEIGPHARMYTVNGRGEEFKDPKKALASAVDSLVDRKLMLSPRFGNVRQSRSEVLPEVVQLLNSTDIEARMTEKGIGLFAARDFKKYEIVLQDRHTLFSHRNPARCHHCCRMPKTPVKCQNSHCSRVFCSDECQSAAKAYHPAFCGADWKDLQEILDSSVTSGQRSIGLHLKIAGLFAQKRKEGLTLRPVDLPQLNLYSRITDNTQDIQELSEIHLRNWAILCAMTVDNDLRVDPLYDLDSYLEVEGILETNAFGVYCGENPWREHANALSGTATFFNHSCEANVGGPINDFLTAEKCVLTFVALEVIKKGTELTKEYIESSRPVAERLLILKNQYGFLCACNKCNRERVQPGALRFLPPDML